MANNNVIYNGAYSGALQGLASRWVRSESSGASGVQARLAAVAFATMLDSLIVAGSYSQEDAALLQSLCQGVWDGRMPLSAIPSDYADVAGSIVALFSGARGGLEPADPLILTSIKTADFIYFDNGVQNGNYTVDFSNGQKQLLTLDGDVTLTLSGAPAGKAANYVLKAVQGVTGGFNITWGANTTANAGLLIQGATGSATVFSLFWDGTIFTISSYLPDTSPAVSAVA